MKRNPGLIRLSREHHTALVLAKRARHMPGEMTDVTARFMAEVVATFARELEPHFQAEENALLPALGRAGRTDLAERTLAEHEALRALVRRLAAGDIASIGQFGQALEAHVRFEERELFCAAESVLTSEALALIDPVSHHPHQPTTYQQGA
jgi:hemerythrin-like domain-containing protein